jgi:glucokinase
MNEKSLSIGVDVGGGHITCAVVNIECGDLLPSTLTRVDVDSMGAADDIFSAWAKALNKTMTYIDSARLAGIGFAMPGPFDYRNGISKMEQKFPALFDKTIAHELQPLLVADSPLPVRFLNDATCFAVGEAWLGCGRSARKVVAVTLGTGLGSAFIDAHVPVVERDDVPDEGCLWHLPYRDGIADDYFTTRWFVRSYKAVCGRGISGAKSVADQARSGDASALGVFEHYGRSLGEFLAPWLNRFTADVVVFGGNISGAFDLFSPSLQNSLKLVYPDTAVEVSVLGENAAIIGAARLLDDSFWKQVNIQLPGI